MTKKERIEALETEVQALKDEVAEINSRYLLSSIPATQPYSPYWHVLPPVPDNPCPTCGQRGLHACMGRVISGNGANGTYWVRVNTSNRTWEATA